MTVQHHLTDLLRDVRRETGQLALAAQGDDALRLWAMELDLLADAMVERLRRFPSQTITFPLVSGCL